MKDILDASSFELAEQIRKQQRTSVEIVQAHIDEIRRWNPLINALVEERFTAALKEAAACDFAFADLYASDAASRIETLPPLFGVPFTIKEMITVAGFKHTLGSIHRKNDRRDLDATVVTRLKKAGAILLGTTNVPELGFWFECSNPVYGRTNNPYDLSRTAGGSTGGEAALIGAGASPFGLGSDVGGSIRMPAGFCGVFGHKPSRRLIPLTGHFPVYPDTAAKWNGANYPLVTVGPLSRRASDLYPLTAIIAGADGIDLEVTPEARLQPRVKSWKGKTVWMLANPRITGTSRVDDEMSQVTKNAARYFEVMGAELKIMRKDLFKDGVVLWFAAMTRSRARSFTDVLTDGQDISYGGELLRILLRQPRYTIPGLAASAMETLSRKNQDKLELRHAESLRKLDQLRDELNTLWGDHSILIMPNHPRVAPTHGAPLLRPFDFVHTGIFNALEMPATVVPMGLSEGLPLAVQVIAGEGQDHLTLSAAEVLDSAFGGCRRANFPESAPLGAVPLRGLPHSGSGNRG